MYNVKLPLSIGSDHLKPKTKNLLGVFWTKISVEGNQLEFSARAGPKHVKSILKILFETKTKKCRIFYFSFLMSFCHKSTSLNEIFSKNIIYITWH